jgi:hypothetical protein
VVDVRCKQLFYQPLAWATLVEAAREAGVAKSSLGLFFGPSFVPVVVASFALLSAPLLLRRRWSGFGVAAPASAAVAFLASAITITFAAAQPYHLDENVLSGWLVARGRLLWRGGSEHALADRCDEKTAPFTPASTAPARGRNVVVFVAESLSHAASSLAGQQTTPFLAELAAQGPIATRCRVQAAASTKSLYSLLTGRYSNPHLEMLESLAPRIEGLPSALRRAGYFTAFVTSQFLSFQNSGRQYRAMGFDRLIGAEEIIARGKRAGRPARLSSSWGVDDRELPPVLAEVLPDRPFFLVVYNVASHHPYDFPGHSPTDGDYQRYRQALRYGDQAFRDIYQLLRQRGHEGDTLFVLAGDHGENVTGDQYTVRGCLLAEIEHLVPLVFALPGAGVAPLDPAGARQIDIAPTILDLLGLRSTAPMQGRSLFDPRPAQAAYINSYGRCETAGLVEGRRKLLYDRRTRRALAVDLEDPAGDAHPRPLPSADAQALATRLEACSAYNELALRALIPAERPTGAALAAP